MELFFGDYEEQWEEFDLCVHELRLQGYRKVNQKFSDCHYYYSEIYKKKKKKTRISLTILLG